MIAAQTAIRDTTRLTRLLSILGEPASIEELLDRVITTLSELFAADIVVLLDPTRNGSFVPCASIGLPLEIVDRPFLYDANSYPARTMRRKTPILLTAMDADENIDAQLRELGAMTSVWLPVIDSATVRGVLILARCQPVPFTHADVGILSAMSYRIGLSLEQAQRANQLEELNHCGQELLSGLDEEILLEKIAAMFPAVIGADGAGVLMQNDAATLTGSGKAGRLPDWAPAWNELTGRLIECATGAADTSFNTGTVTRILEEIWPGRLDNAPAFEVLALPLHCAGQVRGILYGLRISPVPFNAHACQVALSYASQASAAIDNARLYRSARDELAERKQAEEALRASEARFRALISGVSDVIVTLSANGRIAYASPAADLVWGCPPQELAGQSFLDRVHPDDRQATRDALATVITRSNATLTHAARLQYSSHLWRDFDVIFTNLLDDPAVAGVVATCHDVTERKSYEQELSKLAFRDLLTGLPNRAYFRDRLARALAHANGEGQTVAVIFIDLDGFKVVNDNMGHEWGDQLLRVVADRMRTCLRRADAAARLGGDEFTILVEDVRNIEQVSLIVKRLIQAFNEPVHLKNQDVSIRGSFGIALSTPNRDSVDELLRKADIAMYEAKSQAQGGFVVYNEEYLL